MPAFSEHVDSWYAASAGVPVTFDTLSGNSEADVCIVGAGYTGLSSAIHLAKRGYRVVVLEANRVGWGASGRNGGHVGTGQRADQDSLEKWVGTDTAHALWQLGLDAVDLVCELISSHDIDCELGVGNLHMAAKQRHGRELADEVRHHVHHHLDSCPDCQQAFEFHLELKEAIRRKCSEEALPESLVSRLEVCLTEDFDGDGVIGNGP